MWRSGRWALVAFGIAVLLHAAPTRAQETVSEEAKAHFENGVALLRGEPPKYREAYYQFRLAYDQSRSFNVLGNLGLCAFRLGRYGEALNYYKEYLLRATGIAEAERAIIQRDLLLIEGNSAIVDLTSSTDDAKLLHESPTSRSDPEQYRFVGGRLQLRLFAGTHRLTAVAGNKTLSWEVTVSPSESVEHRFDFEDGSGDSAAPAPIPDEAVVSAHEPVGPAESPRFGLGVAGGLAWLDALGRREAGGSSNVDFTQQAVGGFLGVGLWSHEGPSTGRALASVTFAPRSWCYTHSASFIANCKSGSVLAAGLAVALTPLEIVAGSNFGIGVQLQHFRVDESWYFEDEDQSIDPASWLLGASLLSTTRSGHFVHEVEVSVSATVGGEKLQAPFTSGRTLLFSLRWGAGWAPLQF